MTSNLEKYKNIQINCTYKLFRYNLEMKYLFEEADEKIIARYKGAPFLRFGIEGIHVHFCLLAGILINENEEYSIIKFIKEHLEDGETKKKEIWNTLYNYEFQQAWRKIKKLRDKCYAHNDKQKEAIQKEIQLTQSERNIITNGLTKVISLLYEYDNSVFKNKYADIKKNLKIIEEWSNYNSDKALNDIKASKQKHKS